MALRAGSGFLPREVTERHLNIGVTRPKRRAAMYCCADRPPGRRAPEAPPAPAGIGAILVEIHGLAQVLNRAASFVLSFASRCPSR